MPQPIIRRVIRRATAAAALATLLALAPPAHATGWPGLTSAPGWMESALQWMSHLWTGNPAVKEGTGGMPNVNKKDSGPAIDPDGAAFRSRASAASPAPGAVGSSNG